MPLSFDFVQDFQKSVQFKNYHVTIVCCIIRHGHCQPGMLVGTMTPILKLNCTTESEFLGITLIHIIKMLDLFYQKQMQSNHNSKFGFNKKSSTTACTFCCLYNGVI